MTISGYFRRKYRRYKTQAAARKYGTLDAFTGINKKIYPVKKSYQSQTEDERHNEVDKSGFHLGGSQADTAFSSRAYRKSCHVPVLVSPRAS
jgi:hypothetical protein